MDSFFFIDYIHIIDIVKRVSAFDFDGTITSGDTLLYFIRYAKGNIAFVWGFLLFSPWLVLMKLHLYPNWKLKQRIFSYYFKGMYLQEFNRICVDFAHRHRYLLRNQALLALDEAQKRGDAVVVISASIDNWVKPFLPGVKVAGTAIETTDGMLTGRFATRNCYGSEKISRLLQLYPYRKDYYLIAYGDSKGDKPLLAYADEAHYKPFR